MKKKKIIIILIFILILLALGCLGFYILNRKTKSVKTNTEINTLKELPKPEITGGARGELGIDKNINESTIDEYLNREDSVYRDMRMLEDPGNYENIGGDKFLSGYIKGFEVIPLPYIIPVSGLPEEVGDTYTGTTLFYNDNGTYIANYEESMSIIEKIFPKDKVIFLMCGGGGYAGMTKNFLVSMGWDENKIYNTGGYWYYKGNNSINVKKEVNGVISYDFDSVPYHKIEFDKLTKSANYKAPTIKVKELKINTSKIEIEEGTSFQLNVIVLPNEATNKEIKWISSNEKIATVSNNGLVEGKSAGNTTITATATNGNPSITCDVVVRKKEISTRIKLDDVSAEANEFALNDYETIEKEFSDLVNNPNEQDKYYIIGEDGAMLTTDLWREAYTKNQEKLKQAVNTRVNILNQLLYNKKSFIIILYSSSCEEKSYSAIENVSRILTENNYSYFFIHPRVDDTYYKSNLYSEKIGEGSIIIVYNGSVYAYTHPEKDSFKNDAELKNWLNKYIEIK